MKMCEKCKKVYETINTDNYKFCPICGDGLKEQAYICPCCGAAMRRGNACYSHPRFFLICDHCHTKVINEHHNIFEIYNNINYFKPVLLYEILDDLPFVERKEDKTRYLNALKRSNLKYKDIRFISARDIKNCRGIGPKAANQIIEYIEGKGYILKDEKSNC